MEFICEPIVNLYLDDIGMSFGRFTGGFFLFLFLIVLYQNSIQTLMTQLIWLIFWFVVGFSFRNLLPISLLNLSFLFSLIEAHLSLCQVWTDVG